MSESACCRQQGGQNESGFDGNGNRRNGQAGRDKAHRIDRRKKHATTMAIGDRRIGEARVEQADRRCRRASRHDSGARGAAAKKRSFDRRTRKRFSEAGVSKEAAGNSEKILRHYTRGTLSISFESMRLPLVLTFFGLRLAAFTDHETMRARSPSKRLRGSPDAGPLNAMRRRSRA
ncbi:hypothetical protein [Caballeronia calidae]|uniref:hypothetical protein n=1 Tax=Caballeronia calidae TaxID=1777139 RepID=UPI0018DF4D61|nr:hypothetical protein [Caballeronia calidae]